MALVLAWLSVLGSTTNPRTNLDKPISVHDFTLVANTGESVLREGFDRRRLADGFDRLAMSLRAANHNVGGNLQIFRQILYSILYEIL